MALLAILVAGYAGTVSVVPAARPPIVRELLAAWPLAAPMHFAASAVALLIGLFQLNTRLRIRYRSWHRWAGRVYIGAVALGGLSGFVLALHSSAGPVARSGFAALAVLWVGAAGTAYWHIRRANVAAHRDWMIRSYALTLAAVTLRIYLPVSLASGIPFMVAYPAIAWLCWVPNLAAAEWLVRRRWIPVG